MLTKQKRTLQSFGAVKINEEEMGMISGGEPVRLDVGGTMTNGSKWTYQGTVDITKQIDLKVATLDGSDFVGALTVDGNVKIGTKEFLWQW